MNEYKIIVVANGFILSRYTAEQGMMRLPDDTHVFNTSEALGEWIAKELQQGVTKDET